MAECLGQKIPELFWPLFPSCLALKSKGLNPGMAWNRKVHDWMPGAKNFRIILAPFPKLSRFGMYGVKPGVVWRKKNRQRFVIIWRQVWPPPAARPDNWHTKDIFGVFLEHLYQLRTAWIHVVSGLHAFSLITYEYFFLLTPLLFFPSTVFYLNEILFAADTLFLLFPDRLFIFFLNIYWHITSVYQGFSKWHNEDIKDIFFKFFQRISILPFQYRQTTC